MLRAASTTFIEPCLPSPADRPPSAPIGFTRSSTTATTRRRIRLTTRRGNDWTTRFPLVVEAVNHLKLRSCGRNHGRSAASSMNAG
jgi:hypothetical protein